MYTGDTVVVTGSFSFRPSPAVHSSSQQSLNQIWFKNPFLTQQRDVRLVPMASKTANMANKISNPTQYVNTRRNTEKSGLVSLQGNTQLLLDILSEFKKMAIPWFFFIFGAYSNIDWFEMMHQSVQTASICSPSVLIAPCRSGGQNSMGNLYDFKVVWLIFLLHSWPNPQTFRTNTTCKSVFLGGWRLAACTSCHQIVLFCDADPKSLFLALCTPSLVILP